MGTVLEMFPGVLDVVGPDGVVDPDVILSHNSGRFKKVFVIGIEPSGEMILAASHDVTEMYFHIGLAMREIEDISTGEK